MNETDENVNFVEYVYITIPAEYVCIYQKLLIMYVDFGNELLKNCKAPCDSKYRKLIDCYNAFNAAVAAKKLGQDKLAETLIKYVEEQIKVNYNGNPPCPDIVYPITEDGKLYAAVDCGNKPKFNIIVEDGILNSETKGKPTSVYGLSEIDKQ